MENLPMCELVSKELGIPARLENDANAAALGEFLCGAGKSTQNMILMTLGTGLGGGIIYQGRIIHGSHEIAGELGHMIVQPGGRDCGCGQRGCIEQYCSATGITKHAIGLIREGRGSSLSVVLEQNNTLTPKDICYASRAGDELAVEIWDELTYFLAVGCVNCSRIFDPDKIVFAGGITQAGDDLLGPVRENYARLTWRMTDDQTEIAIASLGNDAGVIGAAGVAWNYFGRDGQGEK
jgi:glucokinase